MKKTMHILCVFALLSCSNEKKSTQSAATDTLHIPLDAPVNTGLDKTAPKAALANAGKWMYENKVDKDGNSVYKASTLSPDSLKFSFPYQAGSTATLIIRKRASNTTFYLQVSNGQFNRSFQGGQARIRFDNQPATTYAYTAAENGSANIIFFDATQKLIDQLKNARKMSIDIEFYSQGNRQIEFSTAGLIWNH